MLIDVSNGNSITFRFENFDIFAKVIRILNVDFFGDNGISKIYRKKYVTDSLNENSQSFEQKA